MERLTTEQLEEALLRQPEDIRDWALRVHHSTVEADDLAIALKREEARLLSSGEILGTNEKARSAELLQRTEPQRAAQRNAALVAHRNQIEYEHARDVFKSLRAVAAMRTGEPMVSDAPESAR